MTLAILLLGLIVATCVIAYLADNLGKNLGKKRISIAGLRPRQTATLISMAASVGIMLLTVAILLLTSRSLTNALLNYDTLRAEANEALRRAKQERERAEKERARAETLAKALEGEIRSKQNALAASNKQLSQLQNVLRSTSTQLRATEKQLASARQQRAGAERARQAALRSVATARQSAQLALARYQSARRDFTRLRSQLDAASTGLARAQRQLRERQQRVNEAQSQLKQVQNSLNSTQSQLAGARTRLAEAQNNLEKAESAVQVAEESVKVTLRTLSDAQNQVVRLRTHIQELSAVADAYRGAAATLLTRDIAIPQGTVLAAKTVPAQATASQNLSHLREIMERARASLAQNKSTLRLAPLPFNVGKQVVELEGDDILTHLSEYLTTFEVPASVRLVAARNHIVDETEIDSQFLVVPVHRAYREGEVLAEAEFDSKLSDARIFNQLLALLNEAERAARAKNVVPPLTEDSPYFFAAGTNEKIFEVLRRVQTMEGDVRVRLVAEQDLSTAEPVRVRFAVDRVSDDQES